MWLIISVPNSYKELLKQLLSQYVSNLYKYQYYIGFRIMKYLVSC